MVQSCDQKEKEDSKFVVYIFKGEPQKVVLENFLSTRSFMTSQHITTIQAEINKSFKLTFNNQYCLKFYY